MWKIVDPSQDTFFLLERGPFCKIGKRQQIVEKSIMEAEYMAMIRCTRKAIWLRQLIKDVGCVQEEATTIMCNSQGSMALAKNPANHDRSKHMYVQYHFIRKKMKTKL